MIRSYYHSLIHELIVKDKFNRKIFLVLAISILAFLPLSIFSAISLTKLISKQNALISQDARELYLAERLRYEKEREFALMPLYILEGDEAILTKLGEVRLNFMSLTDELLKISPDLKESELIRNIQFAEQELFDAGQPIIHLRTNDRSAPHIDSIMRKLTGPLSKTFNDSVKEFVDYKTNDFYHASDVLEQTSTRMIRGLTFACVVALVLATFACLLMGKILRQKQTEDSQKSAELVRETQLSVARKEMVETVSHDLKNPLSTAKLSLEMMENHLASSALPHDNLLKRSLQLTTRSLHSMETLIRDLLDHSRIEAGKLLLNLEPQDPDNFLREVMNEFRPVAERKGIALREYFDCGNTQLRFDRSRLEQVLSNLLGNALKFSREGSHIDVTAKVDHNLFVVSVRDQGVGIILSDQHRIFERYTQSNEHNDSGRNGRGSNGLGLSIARAIVEGHGGKIWVESNVGHGANFVFTIPLHDADFINSTNLNIRDGGTGPQA